MTSYKPTMAYAETLEYHTMPRDGGQIVEVSYACDEYGVFCRTHDRSDMTTVYHYAPYAARASESDLRFEPQNGRLPKHNKFRKLAR